MGIAGEVGQEGGDLRLGLAVRHAGHRLHVRLAGGLQRLAWPHAVVQRHAVAVGHAGLDLGDVPVGHHEVVRQHPAHVQQIGRDGIDLVDLERLGLRPGHRTVDVVPQRRDGGHLHQRGATGIGRVGQPGDTAGLHVLGGGATHQRAEHLVGLAEHAVAVGALAFPDVLAHRDRAGALGQALEVGAHVDVPGGDFLRRGRAADAGQAGRLRQRGTGQRHQRGSDQTRSDHGLTITRAGHSSPPRFPAPARSGRRCCGRSSACRGRRAAACRSAAHSRCRRWPGSGSAPACRPRPSRC